MYKYKSSYPEVPYIGNINDRAKSPNKFFKSIPKNNMIGADYPKFPFLEFMYKNISIKPFSIYTMPEKDKSAAFIYIDQMLRSGSLVHLIEKKFPFNEMISAHEAIASKKIFG